MFTIRIDGGAQLAKNLATLSTRLSRSIVREALYTGGEEIKKPASRAAPRGPNAPHIAENIGMSPARSDDMVAIKIGPTKGFAYGIPQEFGSIHHAAHPFMRPAFDGGAPRALSAITEELWRQLAGRGFMQTAISPTRVQSDEATL